ncbi:hypothetical protein DPMN_173282 [Dreissena polymorpha]|uniref:Secreted protein n=1 Tax=Dreissena polymorpha TaxID=45954 RepID=A0A9D4E2K2_DREPO|nr:hypothetical protein DPMN_173282 [Dreissena polymorpha]
MSTFFRLGFCSTCCWPFSNLVAENVLLSLTATSSLAVPGDWTCTPAGSERTNCSTYANCSLRSSETTKLKSCSASGNSTSSSTCLGTVLPNANDNNSSVIDPCFSLNRTITFAVFCPTPGIARNSASDAVLI